MDTGCRRAQLWRIRNAAGAEQCDCGQSRRCCRETGGVPAAADSIGAAQPPRRLCRCRLPPFERYGVFVCPMCVSVYVYAREGFMRARTWMTMQVWREAPVPAYSVRSHAMACVHWNGLLSVALWGFSTQGFRRSPR